MEFDDVDRRALQFIAEGACRLSGFDVASISVVRDGILHTAAVAGDDEAKAHLMPLTTPVESLLTELDAAERWGMLWFLPHDRYSGHLDGFAWVPSIPQGAEPDSWHPEDMLCALLHDRSGELRGVLAMDVPRNGRRPDRAQRAILEDYAGQAEQAIITALERGDLARDLVRERDLANYRRAMSDSLTHELRNSVTAIYTAVLMLRDELTSQGVITGDAGGATDGEGPVDRLLSLAERGGRRVEALVDDLALASRLQHLPEHPLDEQVDLSRLVRSTCSLMSETARARAISFDLEVDDAVNVTGDSSELDHMVSNLVSNAVKYSDNSGQVSVTLQRREMLDDGAATVSCAELIVADRGIGIAEDEHERLFDEFFRSSGPEARSRQGTGLGLAIVERVVSRHGGSIELISALGQGSTFTVRLPIETAAS